MVTTVNFFVLGILDALAALVLMFKIHRLPFFKYIWKFLFIGFWVSCSSYLIRVVLDQPVLDFVFQATIFFLFLRFVLKIKLHYAATTSIIGLAAYVAIQLLVVASTYAFGMDKAVVEQSESLGIQLIQVMTDLFAFIIGAVLYIFNLGFSYITIPPHDFSINERFFTGINRYIVIMTIVAAAFLSIGLYLVIHYGAAFCILPFALLTFGVLYYLSNRRDKEW